MSNTANIYLTVWDKQTTPKALEWRFLTSTANNNKEFFFYNEIKKLKLKIQFYFKVLGTYLKANKGNPR